MVQPRRRGRPRMNTLGAQIEAHLRALDVNTRWEAAFRQVGDAGLATKSVAQQLKLTPRRVQQLRKGYLERWAPHDRKARSLHERLKADSRDFLKQLATLKSLLSAEEFEELSKLSTGTIIMRRLLDGAAAERQVGELELQVRKLQQRLTANAALPEYSAKHKSRL